MQNLVCETTEDGKKKRFILGDVLELFMHSNMSVGTLCGLLYMSSSLNQRAARSGIIERCNTCLIVFLHNMTDSTERVFACVSVCVCALCQFLRLKCHIFY